MRRTWHGSICKIKGERMMKIKVYFVINYRKIPSTCDASVDRCIPVVSRLNCLQQGTQVPAKQFRSCIPLTIHPKDRTLDHKAAAAAVRHCRPVFTNTRVKKKPGSASASAETGSSYIGEQTRSIVDRASSSRGK